MRQAGFYKNIKNSILAIGLSLTAIGGSVLADSLSLADLKYKKDDKPMVAAHRAGPAEMVPENSLASLKRSVQLGIQMVEIDINVTNDGKMVLFHDRNLKRLMGIDGKIATSDYPVLKSVNLLDFQNQKTEELLATFDDTLAYLKGKDVIVELDLKNHALFDRIVDKVVKAGMQKQVLFITYNLETALKWQAAHDWIYTSASFFNKDQINKAKEAGLDFNRILAWIGTRSVNEEIVNILHAKGIKVAFGTLGWRETSWDKRILKSGDDCQYLKFYEQGVDIVVTDRPGAVSHVLKNKDKCS